MQFKAEIPWESQFQVTLPKGIRAKTGNIGISEPVAVTYATPSKVMVVEKMSSYDLTKGEDVLFTPGKETSLSTGSTLCYTFSQVIRKKSFEKAFHVES